MQKWIDAEDIYITRNGKVVAKLSNPYQDRVDVAKSLFGVLSNSLDCRKAISSVKVCEPSAFIKLLEEENETE